MVFWNTREKWYVWVMLHSLCCGLHCFYSMSQLSPSLWLFPGGPVGCHYLPDRVPGVDIYVCKAWCVTWYIPGKSQKERALSSYLTPDVRFEFITVIDHQSSLLALECSMTVMNGDMRVLGSPAQSRALSGYRILLNLCSIKKDSLGQWYWCCTETYFF